MPENILLILTAAVIIILFAVFIISRLRKCPPGKIMVIYGLIPKDKSGNARSAKCIHGGTSFIWPLFQSYGFLDLTPLSLNIDLTKVSELQNIRIDAPSEFTVGISTQPEIMLKAAECFLGIKPEEIKEVAKDIILSQLRLVVDIMDINTNRDKFLEEVYNNVETELKKTGLRLIRVNLNL